MGSKKKIAIYCRSGMAEDTFIDDRIKKLIVLAKKQGYEEDQIEVYADKGFSGNDLERPDFIKLTEKGSEYEKVLTGNINEVYRDLPMLSKLLQDWGQTGVSLYQLDHTRENLEEIKIPEGFTFPEFDEKRREAFYATMKKERERKRVEYLAREKESIFGYDYVGDQLVVNAVEAEIVKWIYEVTLLYLEQPPVSVIESVINSYRRTHEKELTYEEAKELVTVAHILDYVTREIQWKYYYYQNTVKEPSLHELRRVLEMPFDEVRKEMSDVRPSDVEKKIWPRRVRRVLGESVCIGNLTMTRKVYDGTDFERIQVLQHHHEPIVSLELFDAVQARIAEKRGYRNECGPLNEQSAEGQRRAFQERVREMGYVVSPASADMVYAGGTECSLCGHRKLKVDGCSCSTIVCNGKKYKRIPYGQEEFEWQENCCRSCGARPNHYHHDKCDVEECPVCGGQLWNCDCDIEMVDGKV